MNGRMPVIVLLLIQVAGVGLAVWTGSPPPAVGTNAPADAFSAGRAQDILLDLMGDGSPRPVGSEANAAARGRIVARLEALGYQPQVQTRFVCGPYRHACAEVHNVLARLPGRSGGRAILVNAHYDTQAATPGAADCLAGVASALEMAGRFLVDPPVSDVIFLFNDGEEAGLLGATAFVDAHPWASDVAAIVNLEARGSGGPSWPVYAIGADLDLMRAYLGSASRLAPGSAALALTAGLPLANDISVFDRLGVPGFTLGFARHSRRYHTPRDDAAHLSIDSLQQHGQNAMAIVRALDTSRLREDAGQGVFVAVGPWGLAWPVAWSMGAWIVAAMALLAALIRALRGQLVSGWQLTRGLVLWPVAILLVFFSSALVNAGRRAATEVVSANVAYPLPSFAGFCLIGLAGMLLLAPVMRRWAGAAGQFFATWLWWAGAALTMVIAAPQAAYLALVPLAVAAVAAHGVSSLDRRVHLAACGVAAAAVAVIWYPNLVLLYDLLGIGNLPPMAGLVAIAGTTAVPLADGRGARVLALGLAVAGLSLVAWGTRLPTFTAEDPQLANVLYHLDADRGAARWAYTGFPVPDTMAAALPFGDYERLLSWSPQDAGVAAPASLQPLPAPQLRDPSWSASGGDRTLTAHLVSPRMAPVLQVVFKGASLPRTVTIAGTRVPPDAAPFALFDSSVTVYTIWTMPPDGVELVAVFEADAEPEMELVDRSYGIPADAGFPIGARPPWAAPTGAGDLTIVSTTVTLPAPPARYSPPPMR